MAPLRPFPSGPGLPPVAGTAGCDVPRCPRACAEPEEGRDVLQPAAANRAAEPVSFAFGAAGWSPYDLVARPLRCRCWAGHLRRFVCGASRGLPTQYLTLDGSYWQLELSESSSVLRNDAESTEDGRLPETAHIVHLKGGFWARNPRFSQAPGGGMCCQKVWLCGEILFALPE